MSSVHPNIEIFGVYDRGVPNEERIVLRVDGAVALSQYFLFLGYTDGQNGKIIWPYPDNFLWLTDINLNVPSWIFVYTGKGTPCISTERTTNQPLQTLYWNKDSVILDNPNVNPALSTFGLIEIGNKPNKVLETIPVIPPPPPPASAGLDKAYLDLFQVLSNKSLPK